MQGMRLYHQPGLSNRVVSALRNRLERVLLGMSADGDARAHGNGAHGEEGDEHRGRSRSRGRTATEAHESPGLNEDVGPGAEIPPVEALPEEAEKSVLMVSNALAKNIGDCASKLTTLTEDLGLAVDNVSDARKELSKGFSELREQLKAQSYGTTAVTGAVSHQSAEIVKLLKAFDKFSHVGKWAMSGNETIENNVKAVREEIKTQGERLEQCLQGGFEESRHLKELVRVMGTPEGIHMDTPETPERVEMGGFFPPNPPVNPPGMVGPTGTAAVPGAGLPGGTPPSMRMSAAPASGPTMRAAPASGHPLPAAPASGYPMHAGPVSGHPMPAGPVSGHPMPAAPASGHPMPAGVGAGLPPPPTLPDSLFMAYCPERPGEQRPTAPMGISTPSQRTGIVTRDAGSGVLRTLSPTPYRGDQVSAITALWAPNGLGMLRDGKQQYRRIY